MGRYDRQGSRIRAATAADLHALGWGWEDAGDFGVEPTRRRALLPDDLASLHRVPARVVDGDGNDDPLTLDELVMGWDEHTQPVDLDAFLADVRRLGVAKASREHHMSTGRGRRICLAAGVPIEQGRRPWRREDRVAELQRRLASGE